MASSVALAVAAAPKAEKAAAPVSEKVATPRPEIKAVTGKNVVCKEAAAKRENKHLRQRPVFTAMSDYSITRSRGVMSTEKSVLEKAKGVIPKNLSNKALLKFLNFLKYSTPTWVQRKHKENNKEAITEMIDEDKYKNGKIINNQMEWEKVAYGASDMKTAGCEIFATYNAMLMLGEKMNAKKLVNLITEFEKDGAVRDGKWGTSPDAVYNYMKKAYKGDMTVNVSRYVPDNKSSDKRVDDIGKENDVFIATVYNDKEDITAQIHTVCISKENNGTYNIYNAGSKKSGYPTKKGYETLSDAIKDINKDPKLIALIYIDQLEMGDYPALDKNQAKA